MFDNYIGVPCYLIVDEKGFCCKIIPRWGKWAPYTTKYKKYHEDWKKWKEELNSLLEQLKENKKGPKAKQIKRKIDDLKKNKKPKWNGDGPKTSFDLTGTCKQLLSGLEVWMEKENRKNFYHIFMDKEFMTNEFVGWLNEKGL
jgi:hypothetical protein